MGDVARSMNDFCSKYQPKNGSRELMRSRLELHIAAAHAPLRTIWAEIIHALLNRCSGLHGPNYTDNDKHENSQCLLAQHVAAQLSERKIMAFGSSCQ